MAQFEIDFLDHVAIRVKDLETSAQWYANTLGLERFQLPEWGAFPIFMLSGKSGVALFPAKADHPKVDTSTLNTKVAHFAFNVTQDNFEKAKTHFAELGIDFEFQDHTYFHSIYTHDPDGYIVELTTIVVDEKRFY